MSEVFREIKESLTMRQVAEHFGYSSIVPTLSYPLLEKRKRHPASCTAIHIMTSLLPLGAI